MLELLEEFPAFRRHYEGNKGVIEPYPVKLFRSLSPDGQAQLCLDMGPDYGVIGIGLGQAEYFLHGGSELVNEGAPIHKFMLGPNYDLIIFRSNEPGFDSEEHGYFHFWPENAVPTSPVVMRWKHFRKLMDQFWEFVEAQEPECIRAFHDWWHGMKAAPSVEGMGIRRTGVPNTPV